MILRCNFVFLLLPFTLVVDAFVAPDELPIFTSEGRPRYCCRARHELVLCSSLGEKTPEDYVDQLLKEIQPSDTTKEPDRVAVQHLMDQLVLSPMKSTGDTTALFEPLMGYYNVSLTLTARSKDNPVGGKWTRKLGGTLGGLWKVRRSMQHVLPPKGDTTANSGLVVAEVINAIRLQCFWGWLGIWVILRGDAVPLNQDQKAQALTNNSKGNDEKPKTRRNKSTPDSRPLLPDLSERTVRVYFDPPRIGLSLFRNRQMQQSAIRSILSLGPTSSVVIDTPYIDDRIRLGKGGTSGSLFVFSRIANMNDDVEATDGWRWLLLNEDSSDLLTKQTLMKRIGFWGVLSALSYNFLSTSKWARWSAGISAIVSAVSCILLAFSTGGIETRGDTYTRGK